MEKNQDGSNQQADSPHLPREDQTQYVGNASSDVDNSVNVNVDEDQGRQLYPVSDLSYARNYENIAANIVHAIPVLSPCHIDQGSTSVHTLKLEPQDVKYKAKDTIKETLENSEGEYSTRVLLEKNRKTALHSLENNNERLASTPPTQVSRQWPCSSKPQNQETIPHTVEARDAFIVSDNDSSESEDPMRKGYVVKQINHRFQQSSSPAGLYPSSTLDPLPLLLSSDSLEPHTMPNEDSHEQATQQNDRPSIFFDTVTETANRVNSQRSKYKVRFLPLHSNDSVERLAARGSSKPQCSGPSNSSFPFQDPSEYNESVVFPPVHGYNRWRSRRNAITPEMHTPNSSQRGYQSTLSLHETSTSSKRYPPVEQNDGFDEVDWPIFEPAPTPQLLLPRPIVCQSAPPPYEECVRNVPLQVNLANKTVGDVYRPCKPPGYTPITHVLPPTFNVEDYTQFMDVGPDFTNATIRHEPTPVRRPVHRQRPNNEMDSWCQIDQSDHQLIAVLSCLICWPLGLVAIYYSNMCRILKSSGNYRQAALYGRTAFVFSLAAITFGIVAYMGMYVYKRSWW